jgi:hypothetical protein
MDILGLIGFGTFFVLFVLTLVNNIKVRFKNKENQNQINQLSIDNLMLLSKVSDLFDELNAKKLENTDGFLKFIEESRNWAFQYIEEVQSALSQFDKEISSKFEWANSYGTVLGDTSHLNIINEISLAYEKLKMLLPEDNQMPNN